MIICGRKLLRSCAALDWERVRRTLLLFASLPSVTNLDSAYAHDDGHYEEEDAADETGSDGSPLDVLWHCVPS